MLSACIEPIEININSEKAEKLVVNGMITDQPGPHRVNLSLSSDVFNNEDVTKVSGAIVTIHDDKGQIFVLSESSQGNYVTTESTIQGEVGRSYTLKIELKDGRTYESTPEKLNPNSGLSSIDSQYSVRRERDNQGVLNQLNGFDIFVDVEESPNSDQSLYRWRWTGTYESLTYPQNHTQDTIINADTFTVPKPWPCSGWVFQSPAFPPTDPTVGILKQIAPCECCTCWIEEYSQLVLLFEVGLSQTSPKQIATNFIAVDNARFYNKYHINVEQISLSRTGFEFWKSIQSQQNQGSIFDTTLGTTPTNIAGVNNNDEVLGYFGASSIKSISKFIFPSEIPQEIPATPVSTFPCTWTVNSSNVKPSFW